MRAVIFVGPTLPEKEIKEILPDAMILGPAVQGDIDFARRQLGADVIGLIDGVHTMEMPPWHKEIMSVLADGARFLGAASLGALRAVECAPFGAEPIGEIAAMYASGELENDDEVCIAHAGREHGYKNLSVALVNIRATLQACGIMDDRKAEILQYASELYYPDRNWHVIYAGCDLDDIEHAAIKDAEVDLKAADAMHLCYTIKKMDPDARKTPDRKILNADKGFGKVFLYNDRKIMTDGAVVRLCEIAQKASRYDGTNARNRMLAVELCEMLGIEPREPVTEKDCPYVHDDLSTEDRVKLCNQERALIRAEEWISSRVYGLQDVAIVNDYLRVSGGYAKHKEVK